MSHRMQLRRVMAMFITLLVVFAVTVSPISPINQAVTPEADAQTSRNWSTSDTAFKDCSFRRGTAEAGPYANQLCWLDMKGLLNGLGTTPKPMTKDLGRYELSFDVNLLDANNNYRDWTRWYTDTERLSVSKDRMGNSVFGGSVGTTDYFTPYADDTVSPIVSFTGDTTAIDREQMAKFQFRNIRLLDKATGQYVNNYHITAADAQMTRNPWGANAEAVSMHVPSGGQSMRALTRFTPNGYRPACDPARDGRNVFGPGEEEYYLEGALANVNFFCREFDGGNTGSYLVGGDGVRNLDVGLFSRKDIQAFALSINMGRMTGGVNPVDTSMERAATNQATQFEFSMAMRQGGTDTPVPWQGQGTYTQAVRQMDPADPVGRNASDSMVFKSTATGAQKNKALLRYTPEWRCNLGGSNSSNFTIREGQVPAGFSLNNNVAAGTSEVVYQNPQSRPTSCVVTWVPKFKPSSLTMRKNVTGTAQNFNDVENRRFDLGYECKVSQDYAAAYDAIEAKDTRRVASGGSFTVAGLPAGTECTLTEDFAGQPRVVEGKQLTTQWTGTGVQTLSGTDLPTAKITLREGANNAVGTNDVAIENKYDYRPGTVTINKHIRGEAISDLGSPREYQFELACEATDYSQIATLNATGSGDNLDGSLTFEDVPVARDCSLRPLSGLSNTEGQTIFFEGRDVTVNGQATEAEEDGSYTVRLPDYPAGGTPTSSNVEIQANYAYKTRDVAIVKELAGPAAGLMDNDATYPVRYRCEVPGDSSSLREGQMNITTNADEPEVIPEVRVQSECLVYESDTPESDNVELDRTTISASDPSDTVTTLTNEEAQTQPVLSVNTSTAPTQNRVTVTNHYVNRLGTVNVTKQVTSEIAAGQLPSTFELAFRCGTRSVEVSENNYQSVALQGTVELTNGGSATLVGTAANPRLEALINDQNGSLGVPYGNTCTFTETTPQVGSGILWSTDAGEIDAVVDSEQENVTVNNTFNAAGNGVTINQQQTGVTEMYEPIDYTIRCTDESGLPLDLGQYANFTLGGGVNSVEIPASVILEGSECLLEEQGRDSGTRTDNGDTFEIDRDVTATVDGEASNFEDEAPIEVSNFTVGEQTVVSIAANYDYVDRPVNVTKNVQFDPATAQYISQVRKDVKYNRKFNMTLICTVPYSDTPLSLGGVVSSPQSNDPASQRLEFDNIPDGANCTATEGATTAAEGIDFTQEVAAGGNRGNRTVDFVVGTNNDVELINTYSRRLADVQVNKIANAPIDIEGALPEKSKEEIYYTHNFNLVCRDPEGDANGSGNLPVIPTQTITGPGTTTFTNVPVGAECDITGDQFGQLDLTKDDPSGRTLETLLKPNQVIWQLRRDDQSAFTDTDLDDGETTSPKMTVDDNVGSGGDGNVVNLTNYYQFVPTQMQMTKKVNASDNAWQKLQEADTSFRFAYQCQGVGYSLSNVGLPGSVGVTEDGNFDNADRRFTSDTVQIPAGAWCTMQELEPENKPAALDWEADETEISKQVGRAEDDVESYDFVNNFDQRTVPVRLAALQDGYIAGAEDASYNFNIRCTDEEGTTLTENFTVGQAYSSATVADDAPPISNRVVQLPVGADCTLDLNDSSALAARPQLEVTNGARTPYVAFGKWVGGVAEEDNPDTKLVDLKADQVGQDLKNYSYDFSVSDELVSANGAPVMTIAAEAMHLRAKVDVSFKKTSEGAAGEGRQFHFSTTCGSDFNLTANQTQLLRDIEVDRDCFIQERPILTGDTEEGAEEINAVASVESAGANLGDSTAGNLTATEDGRLGAAFWNFGVQPVGDASDTSRSGPPWTLVAKNSFPGFELDKHIEGAPISAVTGAVADTAVLPDEAETMRFNYTVRNNGAVLAGEFSIREPELAGYTVRDAAGGEYVIDDNGTIPAEVCNLNDGGELPKGEERTCSFDVVINAPTDESYSYRGTAVVTGTAAGATFTAEDTYGAFRLSAALGFLLPDTGMQTLVWVLLIALLVLGLGLWSYLRNRNEEDEELAAQTSEQ